MKKGYTLIEIIVAISIIMLVLTLVLANYRRGGSDSVLSRETNLLMSRLRYAQELTSSGSILRYQGDYYSGASCQCDPNATSGDLYCPASKKCSPHRDAFDNLLPVGTCVCCPTYTGSVASNDCMNGKETPPGGFAVAFSCTSALDVDGFVQGKTGDKKYYLVADRVKCTGAVAAGGRCWPPHYTGWDPYANNSESDGIISLWREGTKGDTLKEEYITDTTIEIKDLRVTYEKIVEYVAPGHPKKSSYTCVDRSPWSELKVPGIVNNLGIDWYQDTKVWGSYPLQATVRFVPPDGRIVDVNDNIYAFAPLDDGVADPANPVKSVEVMLKLKNRGTDCRVVTVTRAGTISQRTDADCKFDI